jgi:hypothetical protein
LKLDWVKTFQWFKEMVTDYDAAMLLFTKSGTHLPTFYGYCTNKPATSYYRLYIMSKPNSHKSVELIILSHEIFSSSSAANTNASVSAGSSAGACPVAFSMKKKEEAMSRIADSMTAIMVENQIWNSKHTEKMQLKHDTGAFYMNIATLPTGARGDAAQKFMSQQIDTKTECIDNISEWFKGHPSLSK